MGVFLKQKDKTKNLQFFFIEFKMMTIIKQSNGRWWNVNDIWWMCWMDGVALRITLFLVFILLVEKSQMNRNVSLVFNLRRRIYCLEFWIWFTHIHTDRQRYKCQLTCCEWSSGRHMSASTCCNCYAWCSCRGATCWRSVVCYWTRFIVAWPCIIL